MAEANQGLDLGHPVEVAYLAIPGQALLKEGQGRLKVTVGQDALLRLQGKGKGHVRRRAGALKQRPTVCQFFPDRLRLLAAGYRLPLNLAHPEAGPEHAFRRQLRQHPSEQFGPFCPPPRSGRVIIHVDAFQRLRQQRCLTLSRRPEHGRAHVADVGEDPLQCRLLPVPRQLRRQRNERPQIVTAVLPARFLGSSRRFQLCFAVLLQERVDLVTFPGGSGQKRFVHQRTHRLQRRAGHRFRRLPRETTAKNREAGERPLLHGRERLPRVVERGADCF